MQPKNITYELSSRYLKVCKIYILEAQKERSAVCFSIIFQRELEDLSLECRFQVIQSQLKLFYLCYRQPIKLINRSCDLKTTLCTSNNILVTWTRQISQAQVGQFMTKGIKNRTIESPNLNALWIWRYVHLVSHLVSEMYNSYITDIKTHNVVSSWVKLAHLKFWITLTQTVIVITRY